MQVCKTCGVTKELLEFGSTSYQRKDGTRIPFRHCRQCRAAKVAKWRVDNPDAAKNNDLQRAYGISLAERDARADDQYGLCAICMSNAPLEVDHDHKDGRVRGMLCGHCNKLLGLARDKVFVLESAALYLKEYHSLREDLV